MLDGLELKLIDWREQDLDIYAVGAHDKFAGEAYAYTTIEKVLQLANGISGFPASPQDERIFALGTFDSGKYGGGIRFHFFCTNSAGSAGVSVTLRGHKQHTGYEETCTFCLSLEAATIDDFASALREFQNNLRDSIELRGRK